MLRRVGNILLALWICIVNICRKIKGDSSKKSPSRQTITEFSRTHEEWKTDWDGWEGVKIEDTSPKQEDDVPDLFRDMQPNFQKPKKIKIKPKLNIEALTTPNLQQFAFDPTFQSTSPELTDWGDDDQEELNREEGEGWEDEELPELLRQSRQAMRKQRMEAMDAQRKIMQQQRDDQTNQQILGATKIT